MSSGAIDMDPEVCLWYANLYSFGIITKVATVEAYSSSGFDFFFFLMNVHTEFKSDSCLLSYCLCASTPLSLTHLPLIAILPELTRTSAKF